MNEKFWNGFEKQAAFVSDSAIAKMIANRAKRVGAVKDSAKFTDDIYSKIKGTLKNKLNRKGLNLARSGRTEYVTGVSGKSFDNLFGSMVLQRTKRENQRRAIEAAQKMFPKK